MLGNFCYFRHLNFPIINYFNIGNLTLLIDNSVITNIKSSNRPKRFLCYDGKNYGMYNNALAENVENWNLFISGKIIQQKKK